MIYRQFTKINTLLDKSIKNVLIEEKKGLNSITNDNLNKVFIKGFPMDWNKNHLIKYFDPLKLKIENIKLIYDSMGSNKQEAIISFNNQENAKIFINRYNNDFINSNLAVSNIMVKLFELKTNDNKIKISNKNNQCMMYNLPYELKNKEIMEMANGIGNILEIQMPLRDNEKNKGFCFIEFENKNQTTNFIDKFQDQQVYGRKLKFQRKYYKADPSYSQIQTSKSNKFIENLENQDIKIYNTLFELMKNKYLKY